MASMLETVTDGKEEGRSGVASLAEQVAEYLGKSLGDLLNWQEALLKEVRSIDSQVAAASKSVAKQFGK